MRIVHCAGATAHQRRLHPRVLLPHFDGPSTGVLSVSPEPAKSRLREALDKLHPEGYGETTLTGHPGVPRDRHRTVAFAGFNGKDHMEHSTTMQSGLLFLPCLAMLLLTVVAMFAMFRGRRRAVQANEISAAYFKTYDTGEKLPRRARQAERNYHNLLESTPPFYFLCVAGIALDHVDIVLLALAWGYVAIRFAHAFVHMTSNKIGPRSMTYGLGWLLLLAMAVKLALGVIANSAAPVAAS